MSNKIYLQLGENKYHIANISENIKGGSNDFIKILFNPNTKASIKGIINTEFSIHPNKTQYKEIMKEEVILRGFEGQITNRDNRNINYRTIHSNTGYENFNGELFVIHQCNYNSFPPAIENINDPVGDNLLALDIENDDPFWLGILFCRNKDASIEIFKKNNLNESVFINCHSGLIVIAVKKLKPGWVKLNIPKNKKEFGIYNRHEKFWLTNY